MRMLFGANITLKKNTKLSLYFIYGFPNIDSYNFRAEHEEFKAFYPDDKEQVTYNMLKPWGCHATITGSMDSYHGAK